jgi:hypothetical protein
MFVFCSSIPWMPFDSPEKAVLFSIKVAISSFKPAPPPKSRRLETERWEEWLGKHVLEHLQRSQWAFKQKELPPLAPGRTMPVKK